MRKQMRKRWVFYVAHSLAITVRHESGTYEKNSGIVVLQNFTNFTRNSLEVFSFPKSDRESTELPLTRDSGGHDLGGCFY